MNAIKRHLPNSITAMNLLSGVIAIVVCLSYKDLHLAALFIFLGAVFDFFDGLVARALGVSSPIGADLDSLADVVSFGVAPAILLYQATMMVSCCPWKAAVSGLIAVFAAVRLAKFNNDTRQTSSFIGLPVPANAIFWIGYALSLVYLKAQIPVLVFDFMQTFFVLLISYLMVSELPMFSFKVKKLSFYHLRYQLILIAIAILSFIFLGYLGLSVTILAYILLSVIENQLSK